MSIATLKKKTYAKYNNSSVGLPQFSINGTLRNQGYVGQTSLSRSLPRTLYNGIYPRGHGGCCGKFTIGRTIQSGIMQLNDPKVIKSSVVSAKGMIEEMSTCLTGLRVPKWKRIPRYGPVNVVKPDNNQHTSTQHEYTTNLSKKTIKDVNNCNAINTLKKKGTIESIIGVSKQVCNYTKDASKLSAITQGERMIQVNNKCIVDNVKSGGNSSNSISSILKTPWGC